MNMIQKIVIMSWFVFNTISLSSIMADTNQSQADPSQNNPQKPRAVTFEDHDKFKTVGSAHVAKDAQRIAHTTASDREYGVARLAHVPYTGGPVGQYTYGHSFAPQFYAAQGYAIVLPNPHHGGWQRQFNRDCHQRILAWMDTYLKWESAIL